MLKKAWYILNYHDINWELGPINSGIGGTFSPDMFNEHLKYLSDNFEFVSVDDGIKKMRNNLGCFFIYTRKRYTTIE